MTLLHIAYQHFHQKVLDFLDYSWHILFLLLVENHLWKPKRHIIHCFCIVQQIVSVRASKKKIHLNQWNIIWSLKRDKISFVFTKLPWEPILDRYWPVLFNRDPHTVLAFVVLILGKQQTLSVNSQQCKENASTIQSISLYDTFRCLQALSNSQWCNPHQ